MNLRKSLESQLTFLAVTMVSRLRRKMQIKKEKRKMQEVNTEVF